MKHLFIVVILLCFIREAEAGVETGTAFSVGDFEWTRNFTGTSTCSMIFVHGTMTLTTFQEPRRRIVYVESEPKIIYREGYKVIEKEVEVIKEVIVYKEREKLIKINISKEDLIMSTFILGLIIAGLIFVEYQWKGVSRPFIKCLGITANTMKLDAVARKFKFQFRHVPERYDAEDLKKAKSA